MIYYFNADEIFEMAVKIEENGASFYRKAASLQAGASERQAFEQLAAMEDSHKSTFEAMRKTLSAEEQAQTLFDPEDESSKYLSVMADIHGGEGSPKAADNLTGKETFQEILDIAIGLEKESILYYLGLKDMVPRTYGQDKVDAIIREEQKHIVQLNALRKEAARR